MIAMERLRLARALPWGGGGIADLSRLAVMTDVLRMRMAWAPRMLVSINVPNQLCFYLSCPNSTWP